MYDTRFSLEGIRRATTSPQQELIKRATEIAIADDRILAAYLVGSFAIGTGDQWSDVDLQFIVRDDVAEDLKMNWQTTADEISPTAHIQSFAGISGGLCLTPDWLHFDVVFLPQSSVDPMTIEGMIPLVDKIGILPPGTVPRPGRQTEPFFPEGPVEHFLYMLGNCVSVIGRNEVIPASNGVIIVRDIDLVGLFLAELGWKATREHMFGNPFPFTKRLRSYLTDEQNTILESLPPVAATIDSVIDGYVAIAEVFLPRAHELAISTSSQWPNSFETASVTYFERMVGTTIRLAHRGTL